MERMSIDDEFDDRRPGYRITRTCATCEYYWYGKHHERRGNCMHPNVLPDGVTVVRHDLTKTGNVKTPKGNFPFSSPKMRDFFVKTHANCVCELHKYKTIIGSLNDITRWCGARVKNDYEAL